MTDEVHDFTGGGYMSRQALGNGLAVLRWAAGALDDDRHYGIEHEHTWPDGTRVRVAPKLDKHEVTDNADGTITVSPSILCDCGLHGFLTDGVWRPV